MSGLNSRDVFSYNQELKSPRPKCWLMAVPDEDSSYWLPDGFLLSKHLDSAWVKRQGNVQGLFPSYIDINLIGLGTHLSNFI